jgi:hypothetical protein
VLNDGARDGGHVVAAGIAGGAHVGRAGEAYPQGGALGEGVFADDRGPVMDLAACEIRVPEGALAEIKLFGEAYKALTEQRIIRSRKIVGDLGEFFACYHLA